ncbi:hypothetical protein ACMX25_26810 [Caballeronia sp. 15715]|uniref:hypothetical protein n=1 Tax=Caballeronia sp. 15715 TaxID=3391030 RepID=UPI0039E6ED39
MAFVAVILIFEKEKKQAIEQAFLVSCFGLICGAAFLQRLLMHGAYMLHNDTFTYLAHSDWLQGHAFAKAIPLDAVTPSSSQIYMYQHTGLRMGASYLLAFAQAISGQRWAFDVYPSVIILGVSACCLSAGFPISRYFRRVSRIRRLALLAIPTFTIGGLMFGSTSGFMPQTLGLALGVGLLFLAGPVMKQIATRQVTAGERAMAAIPLAALFSAMTYTYSEVMPFVVVAMVASAGLIALRHQASKTIVTYGFLVAGASILLLNTEMVRAVEALKLQSHAVVGMPVNWALVGFVAHAFGVHGGPWDGLNWALQPNVGSSSFWLGVVVLAIPSVLVITSWRPIWRSASSGELLPASVMLTLLVAGLFYFRYSVPSPFPIGIGASWSEFKLSDWAGPFMSVFILVGMIRLKRPLGKRFNHAVATVFALGLILTALAPPRVLAGAFNPFILYYGSPSDLGQLYLNLRSTVLDTCGNKAVYLALNAEDMKAREIAALFLKDRDLRSNWTGDDYLNDMTRAHGNQDIAAGDCVVEARNKPRYVGQGKEVGPFKVGIYDGHGAIAIATIKGAYARESDGDNWWQWVPHKIEFTFDAKSVQSTTSRTNLSFGYRTVGKQTLTVRLVKRDGAAQEFTLESNGGAPMQFSTAINTNPKDISEISIETNGEAKPLGPSDNRLAAWNVRNLSVTAQ